MKSMGGHIHKEITFAIREMLDYNYNKEIKNDFCLHLYCKSYAGFFLDPGSSVIEIVDVLRETIEYEILETI